MVTSWINLSRMLSLRPDVDTLDEMIEAKLASKKRALESLKTELTDEWDRVREQLRRDMGRLSRWKQEDAGLHKGGPLARGAEGIPPSSAENLTRAEILAIGKKSWAGSSPVKAEASSDRS